MDALLNIHRSDRERKNEHGWVVSFTRRGAHSARYFADAMWGGRRAALRAAKSWRDEQLPQLYPPVRVRRRTPRNRTGVVGVYLEHRRVDGRLYLAYRASWPAAGADRRRLFYVSKYGKSGAFARAVEARRKGVKEHEEETRRRVLGEIERRRRRRRGVMGTVR